MYSEFIFGKDVFLKTNHPYAIDSKDDWSPPEHADQYFNKPLSLVADFWDGQYMARALLEKFPEKRTLLDLGTATGSVPFTMRNVGMLALGLEGLPVNDYDIEDYMMKTPEWFAWKRAPEIVANCDITKPFRIENNQGDLIEFDYVVSTDCFEHLITERIPILVENIYNHLSNNGYGIFEINTAQWMGIHQTCQPLEWWIGQFESRFEICEDLTNMDFKYIRSDRINGKLQYKACDDPYKILFWVRKKTS